MDWYWLTFFFLDCKALAPTWENLANDFILESDIVIAKVDAESPNSLTIAKENGIGSYPTIKFFPKGSTTGEEYTGGRSREAFVDFLNSKAGTGRVVGGGLNSQAGTVPNLDYLVANTGISSDLVSKLKKEVAGDNKYEKYYVKVAEKANEDRDYADKEQARLNKILQKGGSAPEKVDDIVSRKNILSRFLTRSNEGSEKKDELWFGWKCWKDLLGSWWMYSWVYYSMIWSKGLVFFIFIMHIIFDFMSFIIN